MYGKEEEWIKLGDFVKDFFDFITPQKENRRSWDNLELEKLPKLRGKKKELDKIGNKDEIFFF